MQTWWLSAVASVLASCVIAGCGTDAAPAPTLSGPAAAPTTVVASAATVVTSGATTGPTAGSAAGTTVISVVAQTRVATTVPDASTSVEGGGDDRSYVSIAVVGHELVDGTEIAITFGADGMLHASAGCNSMSSNYTIVDGRLHVDGIGSTLIGCQDALTDQDAWITELLRSDPTITFDGGDAVLTSDTTVLTMRDAHLVHPDLPLTGTTWTVDGFVDPTSASTTAGLDGTALDVTSGGTLTLDTACGRSTGSVIVNGAALAIAEMSTSSSTSCTTDEANAQQRILSVLTGTVTFEIKANSLRLTAASGNGLTLLAITATPPTTESFAAVEPARCGVAASGC